MTNHHATAEILSEPLSLQRRALSALMMGLTYLLFLVAIIPLGSLLYTIVSQGLPRFSWNVFFHIPAPIGEAGLIDGFGNAIQGSLMVLAVACIISIPVGLLAAIYMAEFGRNSKTAHVIRFVTQVLSAVPSVVVGVFAYGVIVFTPAIEIGGVLLKPKGFSAVAAGVALAVLMVPIIALTAEESLKLVANAQRLGSMALGGSRFQTTFKVVIPQSMAGITTGVLLALSRAAGETAPLLFTAFFTQNWPTGFDHPTPTLPVLIYNFSQSAYTSQNEMAWTAAMVLVALVLLASLVSRLAVRKSFR